MSQQGISVAPARSGRACEAPERERTWMQNRDFGFGDFEVVSRPARRRADPAPATRTRRSEDGVPRRPAPRPIAAEARPAGGPVADPSPPAPASGAPPARRTITIQGRGSDRNWSPSAPTAARRPVRRAYDRAGYKPDRVALWAVLMGIVLLLAAATSAHAAVLHAHHVGVALLTR